MTVPSGDGFTRPADTPGAAEGLQRAQPSAQDLVADACAAFNRRDVEALLDLASDNVDWPDGDDRLMGKAAVKQYWLHQWTKTGTHDEPDRRTGQAQRRNRRTPECATRPLLCLPFGPATAVTSASSMAFRTCKPALTARASRPTPMSAATCAIPTLTCSGTVSSSAPGVSTLLFW